MLDIKFIRDNINLVRKSVVEKGYDVDIDALIKCDEVRKKELSLVEDMRKRRNEIAAKMKSGKPNQNLIAEGKKIKEELSEAEERLKQNTAKVDELLKKVPNIIFEDVPLGGEECSKEVKHWGKNKKNGVDHLDYAL